MIVQTSINTLLLPRSWLIDCNLVNYTALSQIPTLVNQMIPSANIHITRIFFFGVGYLLDKWPCPLQLLHQMLVLSSIGCGRLLAPLVILTSKSANFLVMSIRANSCGLVWAIGIGFSMTFGGTNKYVLWWFKPGLVYTLIQSLTHNSHSHADVQKSSDYLDIN